MTASPPASPFAAEDPRPAFRLLFASLFVVGFGNSMLFAVLPPLGREIGLPDWSVGAIFSLSALIWVFASPFWGRTSDRTGRKPIVAAGLIAYCVSMAAFGLVAALALGGLLPWGLAFVGLMLARAIFGAVGSAANPAAQAYVADRSAPERRTDEIAALTAAFALGSAVGPALSALIAAQAGFVAPFALTALMAAAAAVAVLNRLPETKPAALPMADGRGKTSYSLALDPRLSAYLFYGLLTSVVTGTLSQTFGFYTMDTLGVAGSEGAALAGAGFMVGALALLTTQLAILPRLALTPRALMTWGAGLVALGVLLQIFGASLAALLFSQFLQGVGFGLARPGFSGGASLAVGRDEQGAAMGLVVAVNGAGFVISPLTGGLLYDAVGHTAPLWASIGLLIVMALFAARSRRLRAVEQPPPDAQP